jgi:uncharacterized protein
MPPRLELRPAWLARVRELIATHVPDCEVWAYGSRVTGGAHDTSDLDLVVRNPRNLEEPTPATSALREALRESDLPILTEVHDWARLPESFRAEIARGYVVIGSRPPARGTARAR